MFVQRDARRRRHGTTEGFPGGAGCCATCDFGRVEGAPAGVEWMGQVGNGAFCRDGRSRSPCRLDVFSLLSTLDLSFLFDYVKICSRDIVEDALSGYLSSFLLSRFVVRFLRSFWGFGREGVVETVGRRCLLHPKSRSIMRL